MSCAILASSASAAVYFGHGFWVGTANLDGTAESSLLKNLFWDLAEDNLNRRMHGSACGVAVNATHLYWSENGTIARVALDGGTAIERLVGGARGTCGVALSDSHLYWPSGGGRIGRARLDGSQPDLDLVAGQGAGCSVALDNRHLYWVDGGGFGLSRSDLEGDDVERGFLDVFAQGCAIAVSGDYVYWVPNVGSIARAEIDGGDVDEDFITLAGQVTGIAVYGAHIYWSNRGNAQATIGRADLDGGNANREFVVLDSPGANGVAVDSRPVILPPGQSDPVRFGRVAHNRTRGVAFLGVTLPAPGAVRVTSAGLRARIVGNSHVLPGAGPPQLRLKLWPRGGTRVAKRIRRQLRRRGSAPAMFRLVYQADGALPYTVRKRLGIKRAASRNRRRTN
jgi:hypothetical protein